MPEKRTASIKADKKRLLKYSSRYRTYIIISIISILLACLLLYAGKTLMGTMLIIGILLIILGILFFIFSIFFKIVGTHVIVSSYKDKLLIPGIIIGEGGTVLTMAKVSISGEEDVYAVKKVRLNNYGGWSFSDGERVTFCTSFENPDKIQNIWKEYDPYFVPWATDDRNVLSQCVDAICEEEWKVIKYIVPLVKDLEIDTVYLIGAKDSQIAFQKI